MSATTVVSATPAQVAHHFLTMSDHGGNWGTGYDNSKWTVTGTETYINGIMVTVDLDYHMGYVLEVVDRSSSVVRWLAVAAFHGGDPPEHRVVELDAGCVQKFFERTVHHAEVAVWGVGQIYALVDAYEHVQRAARHG